MDDAKVEKTWHVTEVGAKRCKKSVKHATQQGAG